MTAIYVPETPCPCGFCPEPLISSTISEPEILVEAALPEPEAVVQEHRGILSDDFREFRREFVRVKPDYRYQTITRIFTRDEDDGCEFLRALFPTYSRLNMTSAEIADAIIAGTECEEIVLGRPTSAKVVQARRLVILEYEQYRCAMLEGRAPDRIAKIEAHLKRGVVPFNCLAASVSARDLTLLALQISMPSEQYASLSQTKCQEFLRELVENLSSYSPQRCVSAIVLFAEDVIKQRDFEMLRALAISPYALALSQIDILNALPGWLPSL